MAYTPFCPPARGKSIPNVPAIFNISYPSAFVRRLFQVFVADIADVGPIEDTKKRNVLGIPLSECYVRTSGIPGMLKRTERNVFMDMNQLIETVKNHPDYGKAGMILCHNGVVRETSRDGRKVSGLKIAVDHDALKQIVETNKKKPGIVEILVHIEEGKDLSVGDDVMFLVVAGNVRENVLSTLGETLNAIKSTVTQKTEFFI